MNKKQSNLEYVKGVYGKNYANLRKKEYNSKKDYTVRELADKLFISASTISAIEKETRLPTVNQVLIYKKFFGVSLDYLTGDTEILKCDMQMVCDYTGLSKKSISNLSMDKILNEINRDMINQFLENESFIDFIMEFETYLNDYVYDEDYNKEVRLIEEKIEEIEYTIEDDFDSKENKTKYYKNELKALNDERLFLIWKMEQSVKSIIEHLIDNHS